MLDFQCYPMFIGANLSDTPKREDKMHAYRSHTCADLTAAQVGDTVRLSGWANRIRDHGGVLFIDLRDHYGVTQVLCDPDRANFYVWMTRKHLPRR